MRKQNSRSVQCVLLEFSKLNENQQGAFISLMNEFLLASYKRRKTFVEQWQSEHNSLDTIQSEIKDADASSQT